ncbi:phosphoenolpyruvate--protein phosphotransferase [Desulforegula conservatrix]|uniref:phosphoenolpyruvate--protein phosphotransferase n=1 Tax=Desulforegula conservatrix TaxID=153026 RepID=UPI00040ECD98|nr:phosphoenolpyruvate--protein phosphotransferase [Desulforegula conservatrix]
MPHKRQEHLDLLCNIGELAGALAGSPDIEDFLDETAAIIARHISADVCSIYIYEEASSELVLKATHGLKAEAVNKIRLKEGEGIVGFALAEAHAVFEIDAITNPHFKFFEEAGEEKFHSFIAVPMIRGGHKVGVLTVQHETSGFFGDSDLRVLRATASQLAGAIENARLIMGLWGREDKEEKPEITEITSGVIKGESASKGFALAPIMIFHKDMGGLLTRDSSLDPPCSHERFIEAVSSTEKQLSALQESFSEKLPESASLIFSAHFMILKDPSFVPKMDAKISNGMHPAQAIREIAGHYIRIFSSSPDAYIREKATDVEDLACRILRNLFIGRGERIEGGGHRIIVARDLFPSDILKLSTDQVQGVILVGGGMTSHVSILARSLRIPVVIAENHDLLRIHEGTIVLLDADNGSIYINPADALIHEYEIRNATKKTIEAISDEMHATTQTVDGVRIRLLANINLLSQLDLAKQLKAEGIGLYRTEFPFLIRSTFPTEAEQYIVYKRLLDSMPDKEVTIRTLDVGGDKTLSYSDDGDEVNPELGLRSIRFSLTHRDIFEQQIRAILRAGAERRCLRIMFPMISSIDEFIEARQIVSDCVRDLGEEDLAHHHSPEIGMMIEIPSVIETIDAYVKEADFFSIGTNDFIQYMLAVDRRNKKVAGYYRAYHPAVLRALSRIVKAINEAGKSVSVCGEMAHEPEYIPFLLGIGVKSLSIDPQFMPSVQKQVMSINMADLKIFSEGILAESSVGGVKKVLDRFLAS